MSDSPAAGRQDVTFSSGRDGDACAAWLYLPDGDAPAGGRPVVVMAHGLAGVRQMRLDAYAERFRAAGLACLVFDYRHFGASGGEPRQLLDIRRQEEDWRSAVAWARADERLDADRVALWGTSFAGGHVLTVAAADHRVAAVVSQCPFTDGLASVRVCDPRSMAQVTALALRDLAAAARRRPPVMVAAAGPAGSAALMTSYDAESGVAAIGGDDPAVRNDVAARFGLAISRHRPGRRARDVRCPVFFAVCENDSVAPAAATLRHAGRAAAGEVRRYPFGHFEIYLGEAFETAVADQTTFLVRQLRPRS